MLHWYFTSSACYKSHQYRSAPEKTFSKRNENKLLALDQTSISAALNGKTKIQTPNWCFESFQKPLQEGKLYILIKYFSRLILPCEQSISPGSQPGSGRAYLHCSHEQCELFIEIIPKISLLLASFPAVPPSHRQYPLPVLCFSNSVLCHISLLPSLVTSSTSTTCSPLFWSTVGKRWSEILSPQLLFSHQYTFLGRFRSVFLFYAFLAWFLKDTFVWLPCQSSSNNPQSNFAQCLLSIRFDRWKLRGHDSSEGS